MQDEWIFMIFRDFLVRFFGTPRAAGRLFCAKKRFERGKEHRARRQDIFSFYKLGEMGTVWPAHGTHGQNAPVEKITIRT